MNPYKQRKEAKERNEEIRKFMGFSKHVVCLDFSIDVPVTSQDFLMGQRQISKTQVSREGKHLKVLEHQRQSLEVSYKSIMIDATKKLPSFAQAVLPKFVILMEQRVDFPFNRSSLLCLAPRMLEGASCFSETIFSNLNEPANFETKIPQRLSNTTPYSSEKLELYDNWTITSYIPRASYLEGIEQAPNLCTVHKRLILDLGSENLILRKIRGFLIQKFSEAFINLTREVLVACFGWTRIPGNIRPQPHDFAGDGKKASDIQVWPFEGRDPIPDQANEFLKRMKDILEASQKNENEDDGEFGIAEQITTDDEEEEDDDLGDFQSPMMNSSSSNSSFYGSPMINGSKSPGNLLLSRTDSQYSFDGNTLLEGNRQRSRSRYFTATDVFVTNI